MSGLHYQQQVDEDDELNELARADIVFARMAARGRHWPVTIGVVEIIAGIIITILGALEVFILPMVESKHGERVIVFDQDNCYGCGLFAGIVMVLTGSTAIRASISQRNTTVYRFFNLTIFSLLVYTGLTIFLIVGYAEGWTSTASKNGSHIQEVHVFVTIFTVLGLLFALTGFLQYFDVICCGEHPLWDQWSQFCQCCLCCQQRTRSRILESGLSEDPRTQNIPV